MRNRHDCQCKPISVPQPRLGALAAALLLILGAEPAWAQSAAPGATLLDTVVVKADDAPSLEAQRIKALAGGVSHIGEESLPDTANLTIARALQAAPGVVVQSFFGGNDQPRIQIRGSGLQQNPVERGILVLQDGLPLNRADGSYVVGLANPQQASALEVYRGYMANRLGATVLGGAINLISPNGSEQPGYVASLGAGSFGQIGALARAGFSRDAGDLMLQASHSERDGFREYNHSQRSSFSANGAWQWSETARTRFYAAFVDLGFDVSGPLTRDQLESDPQGVHRGPQVTPTGMINPGPNVPHDRPNRESEQALVGSRTSVESGPHLLDLVVAYTRTDDVFRFPVASGIRTTSGGDATGLLRYAWSGDGARALPLFEASAQFTDGSADRENYLNAAGTRGALFGRSRLQASTLSLHAGFHLPIGERWTLSPALDHARARRSNEDRYLDPTRPTLAYNPANPSMRLPDGAIPTVSTSYSRRYSGWSPSLALSFAPSAQDNVFLALSRSFEPPTHDDLLATVNGTPFSSAGRPQPPNPALPADAFRTPDLRAQTASTIELGWRGDRQGYGIDAVLYHSRVRNELLSLRDQTGSSLGAVNADRTIHDGLELGAWRQLGPSTRARLTWTWQDFRFRDDPLRGDNRLAGAPRQVITAMVDQAIGEAWTVNASVRWVPVRTPVDNMNTVWADPYAVTDLRVRYRINPNWQAFAEVTNLFDRVYAASTLIVDQARPDQAAFMPGDGRGLFAGVRLQY